MPPKNRTSSYRPSGARPARGPSYFWGGVTAGGEAKIGNEPKSAFSKEDGSNGESKAQKWVKGHPAGRGCHFERKKLQLELGRAGRGGNGVATTDEVGGDQNEWGSIKDLVKGTPQDNTRKTKRGRVTL